MPARAVFPLMLVRTAGLPLAQSGIPSFFEKTAEAALRVGSVRQTEARLLLEQHFDRALASLPKESELRTAVYNARKVFFQKQKLPAEAVVLAFRAEPLLQEFCAALSEYHQSTLEQKRLQEARHQEYDRELSTGFRALQVFAGQENFQRSLLFSSHTLLTRLPKWIETPVEKFTRKDRQTALAVLQYAGRMAAKTSPLSRFTTVSLQAVSSTGAEVLPVHKAVVTPNAALLEPLYDVLLTEPAFIDSLRVLLNPCIVQPEAHTYNWLYFNGKEEAFQQAAADPVLHLIVGELLQHQRRLPVVALLARLSAEIAGPPDALRDFVLRLLDLGFLEWEWPESGLSAAWCGRLYQYLGFLPARPVIVDTAALLQWLRTAARTLPYLPVPEAATAQREAAEQVRIYFEKYGLDVPPIPAEQLFFEDVEHAASMETPAEAIRLWVDQLADTGRSAPDHTPATRTALVRHLKQHVPPGEDVPFLDIARTFLQQGLPAVESSDEAPTGIWPRPHKIGALLQPFQQNGAWYAVVNGLFPGGGKLFARWMHLFPDHFREQLIEWNRHRPPELAVSAFPWQGWFNANFQPLLSGAGLSVPGGRAAGTSPESGILLGNVDLHWKNEHLFLRDRISGMEFQLTDLGLEAPETRPPSMQILGQIGVPPVSAGDLLPAENWQFNPEAKLYHRARHLSGQLVLARASWLLEPECRSDWQPAQSGGFEFYELTRAILRGMGVPRHFFAGFIGEKPQYFDRESPVSMLFFQKMLQKGNGRLQLTEMLPLPDGRSDWRAVEYVVEFEI